MNYKKNKQAQDRDKSLSCAAVYLGLVGRVSVYIFRLGKQRLQIFQGDMNQVLLTHQG